MSKIEKVAYIAFMIGFLFCKIGSAKEIKVLSIDTGLDSNHFLISNYLNTNDIPLHPESYLDFNGHGTFIASLIVKDTCTKVKLYSCSYYNAHSSNFTILNNLMHCYQRAKDEHFDYINFSSVGTQPIPEEYEMLKTILINKPTTLVVAAGNYGRNLGNPCYGAFPACYYFKNMIVVGNLEENGFLNKTSDYGLDSEVFEIGSNIRAALPSNRMGYMTGTSMATAIYTNKLLKERCKEINK